MELFAKDPLSDEALLAWPSSNKETKDPLGSSTKTKEPMVIEGDTAVIEEKKEREAKDSQASGLSLAVQSQNTGSSEKTAHTPVKKQSLLPFKRI